MSLSEISILRLFVSRGTSNFPSFWAISFIVFHSHRRNSVSILRLRPPVDRQHLAILMIVWFVSRWSRLKMTSMRPLLAKSLRYTDQHYFEEVKGHLIATPYFSIEIIYFYWILQDVRLYNHYLIVIDYKAVFVDVLAHFHTFNISVNS